MRNERVLVVGGSRGIGREIAAGFAGRGARVAVIARKGPALEDLQDDLGGHHVVLGADMRDAFGAIAAVEEAAAALGGLDGAVNTVGTLGPIGPVAEIPPDAFAATVETNLTALLHALQGEIHQLRAHGGWITNLASNIGSHLRRPGFAAYAASKAAVSTLTRSAALDHIGDGVRINAVSPGPVDTPMSFRPGESVADRDQRMRETNPSGRVASPGEVFDAVLYLAKAQYCVGADLVLDGGAAV